MMNCLLTGANGFLGKAMINKLRDQYQLITLSRSIGDYKICLENEVPIFKQQFEVVVHAAGKAHSLPQTLTEKDIFHQVNVIGTENLLKGLSKFGYPKQFIFISSVAVYGLDSGSNISENHPLNAKDAYGLSKIEAERLIIDWCEKNNVVCTILRLPLLVGVDPPGNLGAMLHAIEKGYYFNIGGGNARKSMVLVEDVSLLMSIVINIAGVFNLTDGYHPSFKELSDRIALYKNKAKPLNINLKIAVIVGFIGDFIGLRFPINSLKVKKMTSDLTFDDSKARLLLKWKPNPVLENLDHCYPKV